MRGRLKRASLEGAAYPIAQLKVTLKREPADAKTVGIETVTSEDGMFYFYKIPPTYILDISPSEPPFPKNIEVRGVASYEDIQEITLPVPTNPGPTPTPSPGDWTYNGS